MKTHEFIEEMQELGYSLSLQRNPLQVYAKTLDGEYHTLAEIDQREPNKINTTLDSKGLLTDSEDAIRICFLYAQTPIEDREADYYYLKTDYDITGRNDYVYSIYYKRITFTGAKDDAEQYTRKEAIEIANEYPYLELVGIE